MIEIKKFTFNAFEENTYVLFDESKHCLIIDPGCYSSDEENELIKFIENEDLNPDFVLSTHCHIDHVLGNFKVKNHFDIPLKIPELEIPVYESVKSYSDLYGFAGYQEADVDEYIPSDGKLSFGKSELEIAFTPGHSPGHIVLISNHQKFVIGGDVLFQSSIGRTDLPGGDHQQLLDSIRNKLFILEDDYIVHPGHGSETNIGFEKKFNPFLN
ncbi:MAG: MBL fold metallo-hydrolase [Bacteroidota bacterium]